jgi:ubiquinone/menaquinone biosynthesis C-methylase UbiE
VFKRPLSPHPDLPHVLVDPALATESEYTSSFGFEWTKIDGFIGKEMMSHGHLYGRFLLPADFLQGKVVADIGCGNGRIGRLIARDCQKYVGLDMSDSLTAFPTYIEGFENVILVRASATDLPVEDESVDVAFCWGVMHHTDRPEKTFDELVRIVKPGGHILIYVYPPAFDCRRNFNQLVRELPHDITFNLVERTSDELDSWCEVDDFYGNIVARQLHMSRKQSREWQIFQWFDGISPRYHWSVTQMLLNSFTIEPLIADQTRGIFIFIKPDQI